MGLTPLDIVKFAAAFGTWLKEEKLGKPIVVIGRDARISGEMVSDLVSSTLIGLGFDCVDLGLSTTPTVEMAVTFLEARGGIVITASHNPIQWNALKLLNHKGEFINEADGKAVLEIAENESFEFAEVSKLGKRVMRSDMLEYHLDQILSLKYIDRDAIKLRNFKVVVDAVNSSGGIAVPLLLKLLGVEVVHLINCTPDGDFAHNPEPLPEHLKDLCSEVVREKADLGISVDPDVDRLALVCENGEVFGEEYSLVAVADYVLGYHPAGNTVSNLSSTRALRDVTEKQGGRHSASAVGEVHVVAMMKSTMAVIGGEGNGGIILPELHYGRDALVGIALLLSHLAKCGKSASVLRRSYPSYYISKNKIDLPAKINIERLLDRVKEKYKNSKINLTDGVRIDFENEWVHLRKSNTEPVVRIYAESISEKDAEALARKIICDIRELIPQNITG